jgi:hypothetical protein
MKNIILIIVIFFGINNFCSAQIEKQENQKTDIQKVEIKKGNNCPVACNKNCTKDPKTCPKAQKEIKKSNNKNNNKNSDILNDTLKNNKNDTLKENKKYEPEN